MSASMMPTMSVGNVVSREGAPAAQPDPRATGHARCRRSVEGVITEVTIAPQQEHPHFTAVLKRCEGEPAEGRYVRLRWMGQRTVPGVRAGTRIRCRSLVCHVGGEPTMFNPRYEIITAGRSPQR